MSDSRTAHESLSGNGVSDASFSYFCTYRSRWRGRRRGRRTRPKSAGETSPSRLTKRLCVHLADRIEANGSNRPNITKKWRDSARLMLDNDKRTKEQIHTAIDWCQGDDFWRINVMSMPTLRNKYDRLRLAALKDQRGKPSATKPTNYSDRGVHQWLVTQVMAT